MLGYFSPTLTQPGTLRNGKGRTTEGLPEPLGRDAPGGFPEASISFSSGEHSVQGKAGAAWGCRPTEHPLPTPAGNPASSHLACTSLWPGQFLGKTDACHKPLGNRSHAFTLWETPALGHGLQAVLFPVEELRANGALGKAEAGKGGAVARKAARKMREM